MMLLAQGAIHVQQGVMLSKRQRPYDAEGFSKRARLRRNLEDIFASGQLSADRLTEVCKDINRIDPTSFADVARLPAKGKCRNQSRWWRRKLMRKTTWMPHYWAQVRVLNVKTDKEEWQWMAFHLPNEIVQVLQENSALEKLLDTTSLDPKSLMHLDECETDAGCALLGLGLWADECPCNWDRSESLAVLSLNLPGLSGDKSSLRIPITCFGEKQKGPNTWHDIMSVVKWSLEILATGQPAEARHDGSQWLKSDSKRKTGKAVQRSCLVEVRADWKFVSGVFKFPAHNLGEGICWTCTCKPQEVSHISI